MGLSLFRFFTEYLRHTESCLEMFGLVDSLPPFSLSLVPKCFYSDLGEKKNKGC